MAYINICGFETGDNTEYTPAIGSFSIQSATVRTGAYAARANMSGASIGGKIQAIDAAGALTGIGRTLATYYCLYVRFAAFPAAQVRFAGVVTSGNAAIVMAEIDSSGDVRLVGATTSSVVDRLSLDRWYRIEFKCVTSGTSECMVDGGVPQTCTANAGTQDAMMIGSLGASPTMDVYYDDCAISDSGYPGAGQVNILKPNATGNYTAWANGAGTAPTNVAEVPKTDDTGYITSSTSGEAETEAMDSAATGGVAGTIGAVKGVAFIRDEGGVSSVALRVRSGITDSDNTASNQIVVYVPQFKIFSTDPNTAAPWTNAGIDGLEVGVVNSANVAVRCTALYAMVWSAGQRAVAWGGFIG